MKIKIGKKKIIPIGRKKKKKSQQKTCIWDKYKLGSDLKWVNKMIASLGERNTPRYAASQQTTNIHLFSSSANKYSFYKSKIPKWETNT